MTREEAIKNLEMIRIAFVEPVTKEQGKLIDDTIDMAISALSENKGEWIEVVTERFPNGEKRMWHYECSACSTGEPPCPINKEHWDFCPNCGADMKGGAE